MVSMWKPEDNLRDLVVSHGFWEWNPGHWAQQQSLLTLEPSPTSATVHFRLDSLVF